MWTPLATALETSGAHLADRGLRLITPKKPLPREVASWRVAFCGASVGRAWHLPWVYPGFELFTEGAFDKQRLIDRAIATAPDAIFVKVCAAYFPGHGGRADREAYAQWMTHIDQAGIQPVVVTVVPVTAAHAAAHPGRAESLGAFNDALRSLARDRQLPLLDLERALRVSKQHRNLRPGLDAGDGLHLKNRSYRERLDHLIPIALMAAWRRQRGEVRTGHRGPRGEVA